MIGAGPAWGSTHGNGDFDMQRQQQRDPVHVVWFKRDLRIEDHRPLARAAAMGRALPLFVVEPDLWREPDMSARQWAFVIECLEELRASLAALGQPLVVRVGAVPDVLEELDAAVGIAALHSHEETGNARTYRRDIAVADWCRQRAIPWREEWQGGVIRRLASRNGWAGRWDRFMAEPITAPLWSTTTGHWRSSRPRGPRWCTGHGCAGPDAGWTLDRTCTGHSPTRS